MSYLERGFPLHSLCLKQAPVHVEVAWPLLEIALCEIILSFRGQEKKMFFYTVIHTLLKRIPQSLVCSPLSHFPPTLPFS